ncbi:APC family permease [Kolteria novifilia]|uniref:APC family permease n=1 Tax=Kolteria novifilia TaxID=2527975 RepID=UPI003AF3C2AF
MEANSEPSEHRPHLGVASLVLITVAAIDSIRNLPAIAEYGLAAVTFILAGALFFLIPTALVSAELASGWPQRGGIYVWVREAFGERMGFVAAWLQWVHNVPWYPSVLTFMAATFGYVVGLDFATRPGLTVAFILAVLWSTTIANLFGMRISGLISSVGAMVGTILPSLVIVGLGAYWVLRGEPLQMKLGFDELIPETNLGNLVFFSTVALGMAGIELSANHAREVKQPRTSYPRAILVATLIIGLTYILIALAIASVVPKQKLSIVTGLMQAIESLLGSVEATAYVPWIAAMIVAGTFALFSTQLFGPLKAMMVVSHDGSLPAFFGRVNRHGAPRNLLLTQAVLASLICLVFAVLPNESTVFFVMGDLAAMLYLVMYLLMFASVVRLRWSRPDVERPYKIPGGSVGLIAITGAGMLCSFFVLGISLVPPEQIDVGSHAIYVGILVGGLVAFLLPPFVIYAFTARSGVGPITSMVETSD